MTPDEIMNVATDLAAQSVANGWGGPFGAVVAKDGEIMGMGQNRVLLTGDITAHAEMEAIRKTVAAVNPYAPSIAPHERNLSTLTLIPRPEGPMTRYPSGRRCSMNTKCTPLGSHAQCAWAPFTGRGSVACTLPAALRTPARLVLTTRSSTKTLPSP